MPLVVFDRALRAVGVGGGKRGAHVLEADAIFGQGMRIELDAHAGQGGAANHDLAYPFELREPLLENIAGQIIHLTARLRLRRQREDKDRRVGGIDLAIGRIGRQVGRQVGARRVDRRLHVARGTVDVAINVELEDDAGRARGCWPRSFR